MYAIQALEMDPARSAQQILLCNYCQSEPLQSHCDLCRVDLCITCVGKHLADLSKTHNVVPYVQKIVSSKYPKCLNHSPKQCELYCDKCDVPVCSICISNEHNGHNVSDILKKIESKRSSLRTDLEELETRIFPRYEAIASDVQVEKTEAETDYEKLMKTADQQGELLHQEITSMVNQRKCDIEDIKVKHLAVLNQYSKEITQSIDKLQKTILDLRNILQSNDISLASAYVSRNAEFRRLPPKIQITSPTLSPLMINTETLYEMFGPLSTLSIAKRERGCIKKTPKAVSPPPLKPLLDEPLISATIDTEYRPSSVSCLSDEEVWICGNGKTMKLNNLKGEQLKTIQTKSGNTPRDIAVTHGGDLVYTDPETRSVNMVKNEQIKTLIRLHKWDPLYLCSASSDDILIAMLSDDRKQSKVVRYSGSTETQTIQFDDQGKPFYSAGDYKYISENRNLDICVADDGAEAVVVVNQSGKFRFRYTGYPSITKESFDLRGIATNSQGQILVADRHTFNHRIHIIDQDGQFLRYIENCGLVHPCGLCVDIRDDLFVSEYWSGKVKKIQYLKSLR
ncbi:E3 ubiquitin-protein ligase TRIM71-like [Ostrea edulis]|uniref:E3 ubiquitin-protein ligase TRIM71-like n=1 Tax=Ostrea edulis TaxID=37623 RepID=UPI002095185C|nr:E3 ubiquitin-protein ligase TRIM71-like [Ostrea edulis]XP_048766825.1 E3 ubiquitin-protein ligase TRIM71-like [Ostrea edulis]XP_056015242.1 E3 ubiquitin-protein ligase TRIM71-like [Ostrea edulis]